MIQLNQRRFWDNLMTLAQITEPNQPYTRRSFSPMFFQGRDWIANKMRELGLSVQIDQAGNLIGRKSGKQPALGTLAIGSHSDTVPNGGRFDGIAGVLAGLEFVQRCQELAIELQHNLEIIDFLAEEPSEWGISCIGSRGITGFLNQSLLACAHPQTGELLSTAIRRAGGQPNDLKIRSDVKAFFELHIEQGIVLEREQLDVGIVTGIVGIIRLVIQFKGSADHAGATPMNLRKNALLAASQTILQAESLAKDYAKQPVYFVATCGQVVLTPNASNVIAGEVKLTFDLRSDNQDLMADYVLKLEAIAQLAAEQFDVELSKFHKLTDTQPVHCNRDLVALAEQCCLEQQVKYRRMPSGAGHDAAFMSHIAPTLMFFVPSLAGKSHCPEEWTSQEQFAQGLNLLANTVLVKDNQ